LEITSAGRPTLRLTDICVLSNFAGADVFRGESASCDEAQQPTSLPYSPFIRGFPVFFHACRDSGVTVNPCGNNRMVGTHDLAAETARNFQEPEFCRVTEI
jgi:hypothetical protein